MDIIQGFIQTPKKQPSVEDAIPTLCDRVENSTLVSDRRSAVLGLKSFSRQYRETVIASGLKPLINTLERDYEDLETGRAILETLLILFIRGEGEEDKTRGWISQNSRLKNGKYPSPLVMQQEEEPIDQFSLWIADALNQNVNFIRIVFELMALGNFHLKVYTIQILEALVATRPSRTRESIINFPTAISQLVSLLDDVNDAIRDEAILLLMAIVNGNTHIQSLVAFDNIFERLFNIILEEGGLRGSLVVNDCLSLINNIIKYNSSNQTLFLESGNISQVAKLLSEVLDQNEDFYWNSQRILNLKTLLCIINMLVEPGNKTTQKHQEFLFDSNLLMIILRISFYDKTPKEVRPLALLSSSLIIKGNSKIQEQFGQIDVPMMDPSMPTNLNNQNHPPVSVVKLLLHWALNINSVHFFDIRVSAVEFLKAYFYQNRDIQLKFVQSQISEYKSVSDDEEGTLKNSNIFSSILEYNPDMTLNPYKLFFSVDLLMHLFASQEDSKELKHLVKTLNSEVDEFNSLEIASELCLTYLSTKDMRISFSYLSLLVVWLYEDFEAVDAFLKSKSNIKQLINFCSTIHEDNLDIKCLAIVLLGVAYEFSTQKSPINRPEYFEMLHRFISVDSYKSKVRQFLESGVFKKSLESDIYDPKFDNTGLPEIYFSSIFTKLLKENGYQIESALTHDPSIDPQEKLSFETFEVVQAQLSELQNSYNQLENTSTDQLAELTEKVQKITSDYEALNLKFADTHSKNETIEEELAKLRLTLSSKETELQDVQKIKGDLMETKSKHESKLESLEQALAAKVAEFDLLSQTLETSRQQKDKSDAGINKMNKELMKLMNEKSKMENEVKLLKTQSETAKKAVEKEKAALNNTIKEKDAEIETLNKTIVDLRSKLSVFETEKADLKKELQDIKPRLASHDALIPKLTQSLKELSSKYKLLETSNKSLKDNTEKSAESLKIELESIKESLEEVTHERDSLKTENDDLLSSFDSFEQELEITKEKLELKMAEFVKLKTEYDSKILELEQVVKDLEKQVNEKTVFEKDLSNEKTALSAQISSLEAQTTETNQKLKDYETQVDELNSKVSELTATNNKLETNIKELNTALDSFKSRVVEYEKMEKDMNDKVATHIDELKGSIKEKDDLSNKFADVKKQLKESTESLDQLSKTSESELADLKSKVQSLEDKNQGLETELKDAKSKLLESQAQFESLQEKVEKETAELGAKTSTLTEELSLVTIARESLDKKVKSLESQLAENTAHKTKLETQLSNSEATRSSLETKNGELVASLDLIKQECAQLKKDLSGLQTSKDVLEKDINDKETTLESKTSAHLELESKLDELHNSLSDHKKQLAQSSLDLSNQSKSHEDKTAVLKKALLESEKGKADADKALDQLRAELEKKTRDKETSDSDITNLKKNVSLLSASVSELENVNIESEIQMSCMTKEIQELTSCKKSAEEALESEKKQWEKKLDRETQLIEKNSVLEKEKSEIELKLKSETENAARFKERVVEVEKKSQEDILDLKEQLKAVKEQLKGKTKEFEKERKMLTEGSNTATLEYVEKISTLENQLSKEEKEHAVTLAALETEKSKVEEELEQVAKSLKTKEQELNFKAQEIQTTETVLKEKDCLMTIRELELKKIFEKKHGIIKELAELKIDLKTKLSALEEKDLEIKSLKTDLAKENSSESSKVVSLESQVEVLKKELQTAKESQGKSSSAGSDKDEIKKLKEELAKAKKEHSDKSEVDELMLLVNEMDESNKKYKQKLKALGQELSSDEEDEGDDEE